MTKKVKCDCGGLPPCPDCSAVVHWPSRIAAFVLGVAIITLLLGAAHSAELRVTVTGGRGEGSINIGVCDSGLSKSGCPYSIEFQGGPLRVSTTISNLTPGLYAVVAYEDANGNNKHDRFSERYAVSGCATSFGPARVVRAPGKVTLRLHGIFGGC